MRLSNRSPAPTKCSDLRVGPDIPPESSDLRNRGAEGPNPDESSDLSEEGPAKGLRKRFRAAFTSQVDQDVAGRGHARLV